MSRRFTTVISDLGGVLTSPLADAFAAVALEFSVEPEAIGAAMAAYGERIGAEPLVELETGRLSEQDFYDGLAAELPGVEMHRFGELWWAALGVNQPVVDVMVEARDAGYRMALLTNNVREWEPRWRSVWPIDAIFSVVVDSGFVGVRKPDPAIYELTLSRLGGGVRAADCVFLDDFAVNCEAARVLGMTAVRFDTTEQAVGELRSLLQL